jgi:hypothetical protein
MATQSDLSDALKHSVIKPLPVRVPFEGKHIQTFYHDTQTKGTFTQNLIRDEKGEVKSLDYSIEYEFTPEVGDPDADVGVYQPAMISVHLRAIVSDLASNNPEANTDVSNPPTGPTERTR